MTDAAPFAAYENKAWPYWYRAEMLVSRICGGVPSQEKTAEAWIRTKLRDTRSESEVQKLVAQSKQEIAETHKQAGRKPAAEMLDEADELDQEEGGLTDDELTEQAVAKVASDMAGFNMFKRTAKETTPGFPEGILYIEGRQLKAALKEAVAVAANAGKLATKGWGNPDNAAYKKQLKGWFPEHVFVIQHVIPLFNDDWKTITEPSGVLQKFVHTHRGDAIGYEEHIDQARLRFVVKSDVELTEEQWAMIWLTGQDQGLGASRSQGFGTYRVTGWQPLTPAERRKAREEDTHPELLAALVTGS